MKRTLSLLLFAFCALLMTSAASATTWYIRADGGGRYTPTRQSWGFAAKDIGCDGQSDAPYPGSGVNQHCAFNDYRFLWDSQTDYGTQQWIISGGDTIILDNTKTWRVGFDQGASNNDKWCWGGNGPYSCMNPTIPSGTAQNHTRILGRNFAACSTGANQPDPTKMTELIGGFGLYSPMNLKGAQYVDVECLNITRHSQCIQHGSPAYPSTCNKYFPIDDFDSDGVQTDTNTHDVLMQDLWIHGHPDRGIIGAIGGLVTANRVNIDTNGMAGWDLDPGDSTGSPNGQLVMHYTTIQFSGCNQEYPFVDSIPVASCYSQSTGGYGDGVGTPVTNMTSVQIDHSIFRYNTQDGEDFGHVINAPTLSITDSASYGNNGGQFKWAGFQNVTFENNIAVANCLRMSQPLPGAPSTYNQNLADFCRAFDAMSFDFNNNATLLIANNTVVSYAPTTFDMQCYDSNSCANSTINMKNNIVFGLQNPTTYNMGGQVGGVGGFCGAGCNGSTLPLGTFNRANNIYYGIRGSCIANQSFYAQRTTASGESCADPQFVNEPSSFTSEAMLDTFNFALSSGSPAKTGGVSVTDLLTDYTGASRGTPPSIGALESASVASVNNLLTWLTGALTNPGTTTTPTSGTTTTPTTGTTTTGTTTAPTTTTSTPPPPPAPKPPYATVTVLTATKGPSTALPMILTAKVTSTGVPTGSVILYTSSNWPIATGKLNASGTVSWSVPKALSGLTVYGVFTGSSNFIKSSSAQMNEATTLAGLK